jgi:hypothetical protein
VNGLNKIGAIAIQIPEANCPVFKPWLKNRPFDFKIHSHDLNTVGIRIPDTFQNRTNKVPVFK